MGNDRTFFPETEPATAAGPTANLQPSLCRGHSLGVAPRGALAGSPARVSQRGDLLAAAAAMGGRRPLASGLAVPVGGYGAAPATGLGGGLPGCHLYHRQKRGAAVGKTRRGKGTKCMVVVDGQGIPLGVQLAPANPSEHQLAESTLARVRVPRRGGDDRARACLGSSRTEATTAIPCAAAAATRHRLDRALSLEQCSPPVRGRAQAAPLPPAVENRAHPRLAAKLPPPAGAPGPHSDCLSRLLSSSLPHHHAEAFMKPVLDASAAFGSLSMTASRTVVFSRNVPMRQRVQSQAPPFTPVILSPPQAGEGSMPLTCPATLKIWGQ